MISRLVSRRLLLLASAIPAIWSCAQLPSSAHTNAEGMGTLTLNGASAAATLAPGSAQSARPAPHEPSPGLRHNELRLARLEPGKDKLANAVALFGPNYLPVSRNSPDLLAWTDPRSGLAVRVDLGDGEVIQTISVSSIDSLLEGNQSHLPATLLPRLLVTGRGLALGDPDSRVLEIYGPPNSRGPSTRGSRTLEFFFYAFDWAGSDVPQVMEVYCDARTRRVVEITLAAPTL